MAEQTAHNSTMEEIERYVQEEEARQNLQTPQNEAPCIYIHI